MRAMVRSFILHSSPPLSTHTTLNLSPFPLVVSLRTRRQARRNPPYLRPLREGSRLRPRNERSLRSSLRRHGGRGSSHVLVLCGVYGEDGMLRSSLLFVRTSLADLISPSSPFSSVLQKQNFLRDQSGMKQQLLTLQQLISVMDPELYRHLGTFCSSPSPFPRTVPFIDDLSRLTYPSRTSSFSSSPCYFDGSVLREDRVPQSVLLLPVRSASFLPSSRLETSVN